MVDKLLQEIKRSKPFECLEEEAFLNLQRTSDYLTRKVAEVFKPYRITPPQYNVLRILRGAGADGLITREIGERMLTYVPDATRMLDRLESQSMISRERGAEDRRQVTACITPEGLELLAELDSNVRNFHKTLLGSCNEEELCQLIGILEKLRAADFQNNS